MKTAQQVWEEAYPDRRKWEALDQDTRDEWERVVKVAQGAPATGFWRMLTDGEWRVIGDEAYFEPLGGWVPLSNCDLGQQNTNGHYKLPVRRWVGAKQP